jgi:putative restriction endonuclease
MRFFVGVTDNEWFSFLAARRPDEVNFWRPGQTAFRTLAPGDLFLFKLHSPLNFIAGGGYFVSYSRLPLSLAWLAFEQKNGMEDEATFRKVIQGYRRDSVADPEIGCIVLTEPFFFPRELWVPAPADWPRSAVQGKTFDTQESESGRQLLEQVLLRLASMRSEGAAERPRPTGHPPACPKASATASA